MPQLPDLWALFDAQLVGPVPGPATITDYRSVANNYLLPELGSKLVKDIDAQTLIELRTKLLTNAGVKSAVKKVQVSRLRRGPSLRF